jgi:hypothetical protein
LESVIRGVEYWDKHANKTPRPINPVVGPDFAIDDPAVDGVVFTADKTYNQQGG